MKFEYIIELKKGYRRTMETEETDIVHLILDEKNRATADRAMKAVLENAPNIKSHTGICIED